MSPAAIMKAIGACMPPRAAAAPNQDIDACATVTPTHTASRAPTSAIESEWEARRKVVHDVLLYREPQQGTGWGRPANRLCANFSHMKQRVVDDGQPTTLGRFDLHQGGPSHLRRQEKIACPEEVRHDVQDRSDHCNDNRRIKNLLAPTLIIASRFQSHVVGLSVVPPVSVIPVGAFEAPPVIVDAHCELYRQEVPANGAGNSRKR